MGGGGERRLSAGRVSPASGFFHLGELRGGFFPCLGRSGDQVGHGGQLAVEVLELALVGIGTAPAWAVPVAIGGGVIALSGAAAALYKFGKSRTRK